MLKNYVYRMDHDMGFAPNIKYGICTLSGCKSRKKNGTRNIEELAEPGSWIIGIGGNNTDQPNKLIYAMEVYKNLPYKELETEFPGKYKEYEQWKKKEDIGPGENVLVSKNFYYFGDKAIDIPKGLEKLIIDRCGYKCNIDDEVKKLIEYISKKFDYGKHGNPNRPSEIMKKGKC